MKVIFDHPHAFCIAHGGFATQIEQAKLALEKLGVNVEYMRWWELEQPADIIHYHGRPWTQYIVRGQQKGYKMVMTDLLTGLGARPRPARMLQKGVQLAAQAVMGDGMLIRLSWDCYKQADACIAGTPWERQLMIEMFNAPPERVHCIPNGVEDVFLEKRPPAPRGPWLVSTATLTERKRVLELAQAAVAAQTPVWIIGRPYAESDPYAQAFLKFARQHSDIVRYEGGISDRAKLAEAYRSARGFVLLSAMESLSLSALEAAACGCPLLLSDLPWARCTFEKNATYCPIASKSRVAGVLRQFYEAAPSLPVPPRPASWLEIGAQHQKLYQALLRT